MADPDVNLDINESEEPTPKDNIMRKLNYLDDTKLQIRTALNNKGQSIPAYIPFRDYSEIIDNMKIGTDTTDATATEYDILSPYTAYVNDVKLTGKIPTVEDNFSFDNIELTQTNDSTEDLIKDYTMIDNRTFHKEYLEGVDFEGKDFLIYMRPELDESQAMIFTWNNTEDLELDFDNNTILLNSDHLTTYTDLFIGGSPTKTEGPYSGIYFGNTSYFSTRDIFDDSSTLIFRQCDTLNYKYLTLKQSFDETKAVTSNVKNKYIIEQNKLAEIVGLLPDILKKGHKVMNVEGLMDPVRIFSSVEEMDNSQGNKKDEFAVVYSQKYTEYKSISEMNNIIVQPRYIPKTIVFDEPITSNSTSSFYIEDLDYNRDERNEVIITPTYISGQLELPIYYYFITTYYAYCNFRYTSEDGITYTLTSYNSNFPEDVLLEYVVSDESGVLRKLLRHLNFDCEGMYEYIDAKDNEIFNSIKKINITSSGSGSDITYSYKSENEKIRMHKLREVVEHIIFEKEHYNSGHVWGVYKDLRDNKLYLSSNNLLIIMDRQNNKTYLCISGDVLDRWNIYQYTSEYSEKETITLDNNLLGNYYIIGELGKDVTFITEGVITLHSAIDIDIDAEISLRYISDDRSTIYSFYSAPSGIYYGNTSFLDYHNIVKDDTLEYRFQLHEGVTAIGEHGEINGDGTYLNHITNKHFADTWLDGNINLNTDSIALEGDTVPNQSLVSNEQIISNFKTGVDIEQGDEVTYHNDSTTSATIDLNDETFLDEYNNCEYSTVNQTFYNNQIPYYIKIKFEGSKEEDTSLWNTITKVTAVIFNELTGEIFKTFKCTTSFHPTDITSSVSHDYCGYMLNCGYSFSQDKLYILFTTGSWGWSNSAYGSIINISNTGVLTRKAWSFVPSGSQVQTYKQIQSYGSYWDDINNQFYGYIESFNTDGSDTRYNGIAKINMSGVTQIRQNSDPTKSMNVTNSRGQGPLFQYKDGASQKYVLLDASNNTIILQNMDAVLNIIGINGYQYYVYNGNLYKYNPSTHSATVINNEFIGTKVNRLFVDGIEYLHNGEYEGKIYDIDGNYIKDITNVSADENIEEIDDYHRKVINNYSPRVIDYSSGNRTTTKYDYVRSYTRWYDVTELPFEGSLWIVMNGNGSCRLHKTQRHYAKQLTQVPINKEELQEVNNNLREVLGENE